MIRSAKRGGDLVAGRDTATRPDFHFGVFTVSLDMDDDAIYHEANDFFAVSRGRRWRVPERRQVVGQGEDPRRWSSRSCGGVPSKTIVFFCEAR